MKKFVVIFLCLQILSGNSFAVELMKVPFLFGHFSDHKTAEHCGENFIDFLWEHYVSSEDTHKHKGHCDENLPFKHCNDCCSHHAPAIIYTLPETFTSLVHQKVETIVPSTFVDKYLSVYSCWIWQPPKIS